MASSNLIQLVQARMLDHTLQTLVISVVIIPMLYVVINEFVRNSVRIPGMKGPTGAPLIGNLWQIRKNAAEQYRSWAKKYGGVYQIQLGNIPIVVVNTAASAKAIFGQNAQALSSRPEFYTFHKVRKVRGLAQLLANVSRFSQIQLEPRSVLRRIVSLSRDAERVQHQPSTDHQCSLTFPISILRPRNFVVSCSAMEMEERLLSTPCL